MNSNPSKPLHPAPHFRSGAVARMAHMPVATLRIWEQRYQAVQPSTAPSGHRLYSQSDVQRVALLRQLTDQGQSISALAGLDSAQLQALADQLGAAPAAPQTPIQAEALRLVVVGHALAVRLQRPAVALRLPRPAKVVAVFDELHAATQATPGSVCDLLVWQLPGLQASVPPALQAAQATWQAPRAAVVYRYTGAAAKTAFTHADVALLREPPDDEALGDWLHGLQSRGAPVAPVPPPRSAPPAPAVAPRRYGDATLDAVARLSSTLACECPRHVAELLLQLSAFETYSAACLQRSPADAALHAQLQQVAATSRALFESALESVARHEGLALN